jgi:hypothetical protein
MKDEIGKACSINWVTGNAYMIVVGKPEGNKQLGRPRRGHADNIILDLRQHDMDWIALA